MSRKLETFAISAMMLLVTPGSHAEEDEGMGFKPAIDVARYNDSNVYTSSGGETSSSITKLSPSIELRSVNGMSLKYLGGYSQYSHNSNDNYQDHLLSLRADFKSSRKMNFKLKGEYEKGHDAVGSTLSGSATPDEWKQSNLGVKIGFGVEGAKGNLSVEADKKSKRYTTNAAQTSVLEKDELLAAAAIHLRFWPKSSIFFRAEQTQIDYISRNADNVLNRYFAGIEWDASGKTTGNIKVGSAYKNFSDDSVNEDQSGNNWSASIRWTPVNRSRITLSTNRGFYDTTGGSDDVIDRMNHAINWAHAWSSRIKSDINYNSSKDDYSGLGGSNRSDSLSGYAMNVDYQMGRIWTVGLGFTSERRDSNINTYDYTRKIGMVHLKAAL